MVTRFLILGMILVSLSSCKDDEPVLPENTANGILTIEGIEYQVNYGMIKDAGPDGGGLRAYRLMLSDKPIGWDDDGQFYATKSSAFRIMLSFLTYGDVLEQGRYEFWSPEDYPDDRWWTIDHLSFSNEGQTNSNHPNQGAIVVSALDGNYSMIFDLLGDVENEHASIQGTAFGQLPMIIED